MLPPARCEESQVRGRDEMPVFTTWARFVYRRRWLVLLASGLVLAASLAVLSQGGALGKANGGTTEADRAAQPPLASHRHFREGVRG
jgi:hypothetical protein